MDVETSHFTLFNETAVRLSSILKAMVSFFKNFRWPSLSEAKNLTRPPSRRARGHPKSPIISTVHVYKYSLEDKGMANKEKKVFLDIFGENTPRKKSYPPLPSL